MAYKGYLQQVMSLENSNEGPLGPGGDLVSPKKVHSVQKMQLAASRETTVCLERQLSPLKVLEGS